MSTLRAVHGATCERQVAPLDVHAIPRAVLARSLATHLDFDGAAVEGQDAS